MSYRAFKRLLGETSLERKCRFMFGAGILALITLSFLIYARQTENLAYAQATNTCKLLVNPILYKQHLRYLGPEGKALEKALGDSDTEKSLFGEPGGYQYTVLPRGKFDDSFERDLFKDFSRGELDETQ